MGSWPHYAAPYWRLREAKNAAGSQARCNAAARTELKERQSNRGLYVKEDSADVTCLAFVDGREARRVKTHIIHASVGRSLAGNTQWSRCDEASHPSSLLIVCDSCLE